MKSRVVEVAGLHLKISIQNNVLLLSCNMDGHSIYQHSRIIRNSSLSDSEILERIDSEWVCKFFHVDIKRIKNVVHSNVSLIPELNHSKSAHFEMQDALPCFKFN